MTGTWSWCDGEFLQGRLAVAPGDRGLAHGLGLFETILALDGRPVAWSRHLARLQAGAERLGLTLPQGIDWPAVMSQLLARNSLGEGRARLRLALTAGSGELRRLGQGTDAVAWLTAARAADPPTAVRMITVPYRRNETSPLAGLKCASYAENLLALDLARRSAADEALFLNTRGELCEAATSNVFAEIGGEWVTPPLESGCLPGTARARIIGLAEAAGLPLVERRILPAELEKAASLFLSSALGGVMPVAWLDGRDWPQAASVAALRAAFERSCREERA